MEQTGRKLWSCLIVLTMMLAMMYAVTLTARAASYDLWVGGTQVTSDNAGDILGNGTAS